MFIGKHPPFSFEGIFRTSPLRDRFTNAFSEGIIYFFVYKN